MNTVLFSLGWMCMFMSWFLPEKWFTNERYMHGTKALFSGLATLIFVAGLMNYWFKWW